MGKRKQVTFIPSASSTRHRSRNWGCRAEQITDRGRNIETVRRGSLRQAGEGSSPGRGTEEQVPWKIRGLSHH